MRRRLKVIIATVVLAVNLISITALADTQSVADLVNKALQQESFCYYNEAYSAVMQLNDENERNSYLEKLSSISDVVYNPELVYIMQRLDELSKTGSGKVYDDIQITIRNSYLDDVDKQYLLGEVTSWGKKLVWTDDYKLSVEKIIYCWSNIDNDSLEQSIKDAEKAIEKVSNAANRKYLTRQLQEVKDKKKGSIGTVEYIKYSNGRYGFSIEYPDTFIVVAVPENGDGLGYTSNDSLADFSVYGSNNVFEYTAASLFNDYLSEGLDNFTGSVGNNYFTASYTKGNDIVYIKTVVGSGSINTFSIKYPASHKEKYEPIIGHLNVTFTTPGLEEAH